MIGKSDAEIRDALRGLPVPEPSHDLLDRILATRAGGAGLVVPSPNASSSRWARPARIAAAVALLAGGLSVLVTWNQRRSAPNPAAPSFFTGAPFWPTPALAQERSDTVGRARYALLGHAEGRLLQEGEWTYEASMTVDGIVTTSQGTRRFSISSTSLTGGPGGGWAIATTGRGRYSAEGFADTLFVARDSLRLVRRVKSYGGRPHAQDFSAAAARYLSWREADINWVGSVYRALFQLTRLDRRWRGSVYVPWYAPSPDRLLFLPIDLRVVGDEHVTVPGGAFDAWVVAVRFRQDEARVWVTKDRGWVVKIAMPMGEDAVWEQVLVGARAITPPAP